MYKKGCEVETLQNGKWKDEDFLNQKIINLEECRDVIAALENYLRCFPDKADDMDDARKKLKTAIIYIENHFNHDFSKLLPLLAEKKEYADFFKQLAMHMILWVHLRAAEWDDRIRWARRICKELFDYAAEKMPEQVEVMKSQYYTIPINLRKCAPLQLAVALVDMHPTLMQKFVTDLLTFYYKNSNHFRVHVDRLVILEKLPSNKFSNYIMI